MPVTITPVSHGASSTSNTKITPDTHDHVKTACTKETEKIHQAIFRNATLNDSDVLPSANGFVHTAIEAHNKHLHLYFSPEDVWFAILSQLNIWINANAEETRGKFVAHDGKENLIFKLQNGDFDKLVEDVMREIEKNLADATLKEWVVPDFTTTIPIDASIAPIFMMGAVQKYSSYLARGEGGFSTITLLGDQSDWEKLYKKLDKLETFGMEPAQFGSLLKPVISRFIESFHDPTSTKVVRFWGNMISDVFRGSDPAEFDGWISAFCFWDDQGENLNDRYIQFRGGRGYTLDGVVYHTVNCYQISPGYASLPLKFIRNGEERDAIIVGGSVGTACTDSDGTNATSSVGFDSVNPIQNWRFFEIITRAEKIAEATKAGSGNSAYETELTKWASQSITLRETSSVTATSAKKKGLMSCLASFFSRIGISM